MHRTCLKVAAAALVFSVVLASAAAPPDSPFVSNWKILSVDGGNERTLVLLQIADKDGKPQAKVLAAPLLGEEVTVDNLKIDGKSMQFDVKFGGGTYAVKAYLPKADAKGKAVLGSIQFNNRLMLAQFNKTDDTELNADDAQSQTAEGEDLQKALMNEVIKEKQADLKELVQKRADKSAAHRAAQMLLQSYLEDGGATDEELRTLAEQFVKIGARYGPDAEKYTTAVACQALLRGEKISPIALVFIRKAEKGLTKDDAPASALKILKALATALKKTEKEKEAKDLEPRIAKLEEALDAEFEKTAVPFKPVEYKGRKGNSKRVAVVELFTGAYCPPCVAADVAFDAVLESYKPTDVILLQYHVHIPAPDRLANEDTDKRMNYYAQNVNGVPTAFLNGGPTNPLGGPKVASKGSYEALRDAVNDALETDELAKMDLKVERKGDLLTITGDVRNLQRRGKNVKLRFLLIEEVARYPGGNGQRLHRHVVRALPGGADGFPLPQDEARKSVTVDLGDLRKALDGYMTKFNQGQRKFLDDEYPLDLKRLKVVALVQDDDNKEIVQAIQADVPEAK